MARVKRPCGVPCDVSGDAAGATVTRVYSSGHS
jgi:hypothetical protein